MLDERTQIDQVTPKLVLELAFVRFQRGHVLDVTRTIDIDGDLGSPIDETISLARYVTPLRDHKVIEIFQGGGLLVEFCQIRPISLLLLHRHLCALPPWLLLQPDNIESQAFSFSYVRGNNAFDFSEEALVSTQIRKSNALVGSTFQFTVHGRVLSQYMVIANAKDPGTRISVRESLRGFW